MDVTLERDCTVTMGTMKCHGRYTGKRLHCDNGYYEMPWTLHWKETALWQWVLRNAMDVTLERDCAVTMGATRCHGCYTGKRLRCDNGYYEMPWTLHWKETALWQWVLWNAMDVKLLHWKETALWQWVLRDAMDITLERDCTVTMGTTRFHGCYTGKRLHCDNGYYEMPWMLHWKETALWQWVLRDAMDVTLERDCTVTMGTTECHGRYTGKRLHCDNGYYEMPWMLHWKETALWQWVLQNAMDVTLERDCTATIGTTKCHGRYTGKRLHCDNGYYGMPWMLHWKETALWQWVLQNAMDVTLERDCTVTIGTTECHGCYTGKRLHCDNGCYEMPWTLHWKETALWQWVLQNAMDVTLERDCTVTMGTARCHGRYTGKRLHCDNGYYEMPWTLHWKETALWQWLLQDAMDVTLERDCTVTMGTTRFHGCYTGKGLRCDNRCYEMPWTLHWCYTLDESDLLGIGYFITTA